MANPLTDDIDRYRWCRWCLADCDPPPELRQHAKDCPEVTGLYPVTVQDEQAELRCHACETPFVAGERYVHTSMAGAGLVEPRCLSCRHRRRVAQPADRRGSLAAARPGLRRRGDLRRERAKTRGPEPARGPETTRSELLNITSADAVPVILRDGTPLGYVYPQLDTHPHWFTCTVQGYRSPFAHPRERDAIMRLLERTGGHTWDELIDPALTGQVARLGERFGPLGVALAAGFLSHPVTVAGRLLTSRLDELGENKWAGAQVDRPVLARVVTALMGPATATEVLAAYDAVVALPAPVGGERR